MCDSDTAKNSTNAKVLTLQSDRSRRVIDGDSDLLVRFDTGEIIMLFAGMELVEWVLLKFWFLSELEGIAFELKADLENWIIAANRLLNCAENVRGMRRNADTKEKCLGKCRENLRPLIKLSRLRKIRGKVIKRGNNRGKKNRKFVDYLRKRIKKLLCLQIPSKFQSTPAYRWPLCDANNVVEWMLHIRHIYTMANTNTEYYASLAKRTDERHEQWKKKSHTAHT